MHSNLESWFQKSSKRKDSTGPEVSSTSRPTTLETDIVEMDESLPITYEQHIDTMNDKEIDKEFEDILNNMNLNEGHKKPLRMYNLENKRKMLIMQYKEANQFDTPDHYISYLENCSETDTLNPSEIFKCVESLRVALTNYTLNWVQEFGSRGLQTIFSVLKLSTKLDDRFDKIQSECLKCILKYNNNTEGLKEFLQQDDGPFIIANCIDYRKPLVMKTALRNLAVLCFINETNNFKVLSALGKLGKIRECNRFLPIIQAITMTSNEDLWNMCLQFINVLLTQIKDLEFRTQLKNEIVLNGLYNKLDDLKKSTAAVSEQLHIFENYKDEDSEELRLLFDNVHKEPEDIDD